MKKDNLFLIILLSIFAILLVYYALFYYPEKKKKKEIEIYKIKQKIKELVINDILKSPLLISFENENELNAKLPLRYKIAEINEIFKKNLSDKNIIIDFKETNTEKSESAILQISYKNSSIYKVRFLRSKKPKIAIIIDDWGYNNKNLEFLNFIKQPFTVAVFPGHKYSSEICEKAQKSKKEILLHLPMQPKRNMPLEKNTIKKNMSENEIKYILNKALKETTGIIGVNNHEGSAATEDKRIMGILMKLLKEKKLIFVDSKTSDDTVGFFTAVKNNIPASIRDVFLDNKKERNYILKQINILKKVAKKKEYAVGIGHCNLMMLKTLSDEIDNIEKQNFEFVYISEILR